MPDRLNFTEDDQANRLLATNPTALLIGMMLDQQFPMERAFASPALLEERLGTALTPAVVAELDDATLEAAFKGPPALHRFPSSMATRARDMCAHIVEHHGGDTASVWEDAADGEGLFRRLKALPGFGEAKARVFIGVIGKRLGAGPEGWEDQAADWPSIADVARFEQVLELREKKRARKAARKAAKDTDG